VSVAGRWFVTPHAVKRYRERVDRGVTYEVALARLVEMSEVAHRVSVRPDGVEVWRVGRRFGRVRFCVQPAGEGLPQLLTVLPGCEAARLR
jgi:hypothetical protein